MPNHIPIKNDGLLGSDFFQKYKAKINYEEEIVYFEDNYFKILPSEILITRPARCEIVIHALANVTNTEGFVMPKKHSDNLYLGSSLTKVQNNKCLVSVLNISNESVTIPLPRVNVTPILTNEYDIIKTSNINNNYSNGTEINYIERLNKLKNSLNLRGLNSEETESLLEICEHFNDIFYLEGDKLSYTDTLKHKIPTDPIKGPINIKPYKL